MKIGKALLLFDACRITRVRASLGHRLWTGLGVILDGDCFSLFVAHIDLAHAIDLRERRLHDERAGSVDHARNCQGDDLRCRPGGAAMRVASVDSANSFFMMNSGLIGQGKDVRKGKLVGAARLRDRT